MGWWMVVGRKCIGVDEDEEYHETWCREISLYIVS